MKKFKLVCSISVLLFNAACENFAAESQELLLKQKGEGAPQEVVAKSFCAGVVSTLSGALNVRTAPEIRDNVCTFLNKGEEVEISLDGAVNGFFKIKSDTCNTETGAAYVSKKYISFDSSCVFSTGAPDQDAGGEVDSEGEKPVLIPMNWDRKHRDYKRWTAYVYDAVTDYGKDLLASSPRDINTFCPNYNALDEERKKMFWMHLISSMTQYESGFEPETKYKEAFTDKNGNRIISRGLLQLSIESARGYKCNVDRAQDLHSAQRNLECGVQIINRWVRRDDRVAGKVSGKWRGGARYWSVLRKRSGSHSHDRIAAKTRATSICKK